MWAGFGDAVYLDFNQAFRIVSHSTFMNKLRKYRLGKWTIRWIEHWLSCQAPRTVITDTKSSWRSVTGECPWGSSLQLILFNMFINDLQKDIDNSTKYTVCKEWVGMVEIPETERSGWHTRWLGCHSEGPCRVGETDWQDLQKAQKREDTSPGPGEEQPHTLRQTGYWLFGKQLAEKDLKNPSTSHQLLVSNVPL